MLIEVYGSLLNRDERRKINGTMIEKGKVERRGWKLSFGKKSYGGCEAVLNFVRTSDFSDVYYTCVFEVDEVTYAEVMRREMGQGNVGKWLRGEAVSFNCYRPLRLQSSLGTTEVFVIPEAEEISAPTCLEAEYVEFVRRGIEESFKDMPKEKEINLRVLKKAVEESSRKVNKRE